MRHYADGSILHIFSACRGAWVWSPRSFLWCGKRGFLHYTHGREPGWYHRGRTVAWEAWAVSSPSYRQAGWWAAWSAGQKNTIPSAEVRRKRKQTGIFSENRPQALLKLIKNL